jgi:hypothetical protein
VSEPAGPRSIASRAQGRRAQAARASVDVRRRGRCAVRCRVGRKARRVEEGSQPPLGAHRDAERSLWRGRQRRREPRHCARRRPAARRRHRARPERALRAPLGSAQRRRALRGHSEAGLGELARKIVRRGRTRVPQVPRPAPRARRHHRTRARAAHPRPPRCAHRSPAARPSARSSRRPGRHRGPPARARGGLAKRIARSPMGAAKALVANPRRALQYAAGAIFGTSR